MEIKFYVVLTLVVLFLIHIFMVKRVEYRKHPYYIMMVLGVYWFGTAGLLFFGFIF